MIETNNESIPVEVYNLKGELIADYESITQCERKLFIRSGVWERVAGIIKKPVKSYKFPFQKYVIKAKTKENGK